jgi:hypothetical protein
MVDIGIDISFFLCKIFIYITKNYKSTVENKSKNNIEFI